MKSGFSTNIGIFFLKLIARLPFWIIYLLSDIFYILVYYVIGYRKKVVIKNLSNSFPEKDKREIKILSKKYFRHFSDLTLETVKMHGMTKEDYIERVKIVNTKDINRFFESGKNIVVLAMHYNNWEWSTCFPLFLKHTLLGVYRPLQNSKFDMFITQNRKKMGAELIQNAQVLRRIILAERKKEPILTWLAGDQTPPESHKSWFWFLNQETMFYLGPASIPKRFNQAIFFQRIVKTDRGKYETTFELLFESPKEINETAIIKAYIKRMEEIITENPQFYLWSHKRWKHKRPADIPLQN